MATDMDDAELAAALAAAGKPVDSYAYRNEEADDDYVEADLYRMPDGRAFRLITASGFDSSYSGAGNCGEWLSAEEETRWTDFGQGDDPGAQTFG